MLFVLRVFIVYINIEKIWKNTIFLKIFFMSDLYQLTGLDTGSRTSIHIALTDLYEFYRSHFNVRILLKMSFHYAIDTHQRI